MDSDSSSQSGLSDRRNFDQFMHSMQKQQTSQAPVSRQEYEAAKQRQLNSNKKFIDNNNNGRQNHNNHKKNNQYNNNYEQQQQVQRQQKRHRQQQQEYYDEEDDSDYDDEILSLEEYQEQRQRQQQKRYKNQDSGKYNVHNNQSSSNGAIPRDDSGRTEDDRRDKRKKSNDNKNNAPPKMVDQTPIEQKKSPAKRDEKSRSRSPHKPQNAHNGNDDHNQNINTDKPSEPVKILPPTSQEIVDSKRKKQLKKRQQKAALAAEMEHKRNNQQMMQQMDEDDYYDEEDSSVFSDYIANSEQQTDNYNYGDGERRHPQQNQVHKRLEDLAPNRNEDVSEGSSDYDQNWNQRPEYAPKQKNHMDMVNHMSYNSGGMTKSSGYSMENKLQKVKNVDSTLDVTMDAMGDQAGKPAKNIRKAYDFIKFLGVILYLGSLTCVWAYYETSRYTSKVTQEMIFFFLIGRPIVITLYCWGLNLTQLKRNEVQMKQASEAKKAARQIEKQQRQTMPNQIPQPQYNMRTSSPELDDDSQANPHVPYITDQNVSAAYIPQKYAQDMTEEQKKEMELQKAINAKKFLPKQDELYANFLILPIVAYGGFGRIVITPSDKKNFVTFCSFMECFLHTLPLGLLIIYNNLEMDKWEDFDYITVAFLGANLLQILVEQFILHFLNSASVNLEFKNTVKSSVRFSDITKAAILSTMLIAGAICAGLYAFTAQSCTSGFYEDDYVCKACNIYSTDNCVTCTDASTCSECESGYYLDTDLNLCRTCDTLYENSVTCTESEPLTCISDTFYIENSQCNSCDDLSNCSGTCDQDGCQTCDSGFYKSGFICLECDIIGCSDCSSETNCILCNDDFLTISSGACVCNLEGDNQIMDETTSGCGCSDGYYFVSDGCQTCEQLIDGCETCSTSVMTDEIFGVNTYYFATLYIDDPVVVNCDECPYSSFLNQDEESDTYQCSECTTLWDGCSYCDDGSECTKCFQTHVFDEEDPDAPCKTCDYYMNNCEKCKSASDCSQCKDGYSSIGGVCVNVPW